MPTATQLGQTGLQGWREKVADGIAEPVAQRVPLKRRRCVPRWELSSSFLIYVVNTVRAATRETRSS